MVHVGEFSWDAVFCLLNTVMSKALPVCYMTSTYVHSRLKLLSALGSAECQHGALFILLDHSFPFLLITVCFACPSVAWVLSPHTHMVVDLEHILLIDEPL